MSKLIEFSVDLSTHTKKKKKKKKLKRLHIKITKCFDTSCIFHIDNVESINGISRWLNKGKQIAFCDGGA